MKLRNAAALLAGAFLLAAPASGSAHFILQQPASWVQENPLGDPQKLGPCGGTTANPGVVTGAVTPVTGGELLHLKVKETIYHPGFFRVALAVLDRSELPADPEDTTRDGPRGPVSVSGKVDPNPKPPVLVDGLWTHHDRQAAREFETDVKLPNINCDHCSLQIIQFMEEHGVNPDGRFTYHHCADLKITANPKLRIDTAWPGQTKAGRKSSRTSIPAHAAAPAYIAAAIADPARPKADVAADALRDPADTLAFAGVKPGMSVAELFPGGGYFTRLLSDIVGPKGHIVGIENAGWKGAVKADRDMLAEPGHTRVELDVEPFGQMTVPKPVDLFWITQNYHDLKIEQFGQVDIAAFNRRVFDVLKPGGTYFIVDHQANPGVTLEQIAVLHRVQKAQVIKEVTAAGFRLVGEGKFLNRPGDDHTKPIFDAAIQGKTDQYALKFVKPKV